MIELKGRSSSKSVPAEAGFTILDSALKHRVDWGFSCSRGTCGRCRCRVEAGAELLTPANAAEWDRLDEEAIEEGYRLACQAEVKCDGHMVVVWKPYV